MKSPSASFIVFKVDLHVLDKSVGPLCGQHPTLGPSLWLCFSSHPEKVLPCRVQIYLVKYFFGQGKNITTEGPLVSFYKENSCCKSNVSVSQQLYQSI